MHVEEEIRIKDTREIRRDSSVAERMRCSVKCTSLG